MTNTVIFPPALTGDTVPHTYTDDTNIDTGLDGGGHVYRFIPIIKDTVYAIGTLATSASAAAASALNSANSAIAASNEATAAMNFATGWITSSSSSIIMATTGNRTLTVDQYLSLVAGRVVLLIHDTSHLIKGEIVSYNSTTGALVITIVGHTGTGTYNSWNIYSAEAIEDLAGVTIDNPLTGQVLQWQSTNGFVNSYVSVTELSDVELTSPSTGQVLRYDDTSSLWKNETIPTALSGLSDITITTPSNGQVLKYDGVKWVNGTDAGGIGANTLAGLSDANVTSPSNLSLLSYDSTSSKWIDKLVPLSQLSDVTITTPVDGQVLSYTTANGWENNDIPTQLEEPVIYPLISGGILTINLANLTNTFNVSHGQNATLSITNPPAVNTHRSFTLILTQTGSGKTLDYPSSVKWANGVIPTLTTSTGGINILSFFTVDAGVTWFGSLLGKDWV